MDFTVVSFTIFPKSQKEFEIKAATKKRKPKHIIASQNQTLKLQQMLEREAMMELQQETKGSI